QCNAETGSSGWNAFVSTRCTSCDLEVDCSESPFWIDDQSITIIRSSSFCNTAPGSRCNVECAAGEFDGVAAGTATCRCDGNYYLDDSRVLGSCGWSNVGTTVAGAPTPAPTPAGGEVAQPGDNTPWYSKRYGGEPLWFWFAIAGGVSLGAIILAKCWCCANK
ncbi:unnamed protein product, partial [Phaeothamnion confervicola]